METRKFPAQTDIVVGRFERNPPRYYEMRIARLLPVYLSGKATLGEIDDLGVAYDRIGKDDDAIKVMAAKAKLLKAAPDKDHLYRYHANLGTFQVHKWMRDGANAKDLSLVEASHRNISEAIRLNPKAHFGRELTQLKAIECLLAVQRGEKREFTQYLLLNHVDPNPHLKGLLGLIVLGNAWESVDTYYALSALISDENQAKIAQLAMYRAEELKAAGNKVLLHSELELRPVYNVSEEELPEIKKLYKQLRANAEMFQQHRNAFMEKQFAKGKHPDTDPDFWNGYVEYPPLTLKDPDPGFDYVGAIMKA